ncbi:hypothetical protein C922_03718 [Plasmodium inui San Antonio 1]|uniref:Uncharacterized protein n=1 Tax=Plasmodium inui San Antonio 1 TaxID=1237626 RepID=W7AKX4_9APIC|nr:hypothetical protein C922_03718 [Plasmodium inui San Antonio 1]EUD65991.1 hypothetical protein C922_03718 [Plasmodium inui San Antonio 1]
MNHKPFYNGPKVTKEDLEEEFDKTKCHLKSSWDELTDGSQYTEEKLLHRRTKQDMCKSRFFADGSKKKQTGILFKGTSKKVHTYIDSTAGEFLCREKGSIPIYGKLKTFKKRKKNPHKGFYFSHVISNMDSAPHTRDGSTYSVNMETPFAYHNKRNYDARGINPDTAELTTAREKNLDEKATISCSFHGNSKNDDPHNAEHTTCVKVGRGEKRNGNNGRSFWISKNQMNISRKCIDQGMSPYSSSKANEQGNILLTTQRSKFARGKLRLRISGKNKIDKMSQVPVEEELNDDSTSPLGDLLKGIMPRGGGKKKVNYRALVMKNYKNRVNHERHADQHNEKKEESKEVAVDYDIMSKHKRQKGNPHVRICVNKGNIQYSDPKYTIDSVQECASLDRKMQNYLNEQLKYYGSKLRRENLEHVCLFLRKRPQGRVPHGAARSHRIDEDEEPNVPTRPCKNCRKEINLRSYIMEGDDKKNSARMMTNARDMAPAISGEIMKQMRGREKERNEGQTRNLAHKNKLTDELKNLKKLQKEQINFFTIYTHLTNEKKILKKILNRQTRDNRKNYSKKLIQVKKNITNFVTLLEQILAKIDAEKKGPYAPTYHGDRHYHISCLLKLVEDVISIVADHFCHVE